MANLVGLAIGRSGSCAHVLTGEHIAVEVYRQVVRFVHAALLAQRRRRACGADGLHKVHDALLRYRHARSQALAQFFVSQRPEAHMVLLGLQGCRQAAFVVGVNESTLPDIHIPAKALLQPSLNLRPALIAGVNHGVDADAALRLQAGMQVHDGGVLLRVIQRIGSTSRLARTVV